MIRMEAEQKNPTGLWGDMQENAERWKWIYFFITIAIF